MTQLPADYHMHTHLCHHAVGTASDLAAHAVSIGLTEIGFSEHNPMPRDDWDQWHIDQKDLDTYVAQVMEARERFPQLTIRLALEVDFIPGLEDWIRELSARHPWDYLIGAVHYVSETWALDDPGRMTDWKKSDPFQVWGAYFERLAQAAESGLFQIIAHADLCKKFCFYPQEDCTAMYRRFVEAARRADVAVELNTAGLRKDCREIYPNPTLLRMVHDAGIPITFASDAHAPGEVGANFADAVALARSVGYTQACRFSGRQRRLVPL
jgi:histidinol-phosphatase (PHP family)